MNPFIRDDVMPSWWANAIQRFIGGAAWGFEVSKLDATTIQVVAGADDGAAVIGILGKWRWNEATVSRAVAGAAGTYDIFVTAKSNDIRDVPKKGTDFTDYSFSLAVVLAGSTPALNPGVVDIFRKVGSLVWSGAAITGPITQTVGVVSPRAHAASHLPGGVDPLPVDDVAGNPSLRTLGAGGQQAAAGTDARFPTAAQKGALAGTGVPSSGNPYVSNDDGRLANARPRVSGRCGRSGRARCRRRRGTMRV
jgi:hypothetical protein